MSKKDLEEMDFDKFDEDFNFEDDFESFSSASGSGSHARSGGRTKVVRDFIKGFVKGGVSNLKRYVPHLGDTLDSAGEVASQISSHASTIKEYAGGYISLIGSTLSDSKQALRDIKNTKGLKNKISQLHTSIDTVKRNLAYNIDPEMAEMSDMDNLFKDDEPVTQQQKREPTESELMEKRWNERMGVWETSEAPKSGSKKSIYIKNYSNRKNTSFEYDCFNANMAAQSALRESVIATSSSIISAQYQIARQMGIQSIQQHIEKMNVLNKIAQSTYMTDKILAEQIGPSQKQLVATLSKIGEVTSKTGIMLNDYFNKSTHFEKLRDNSYVDYEKRGILSFITGNNGLDLSKIHDQLAESFENSIIKSGFEGLDAFKELAPQLLMEKGRSFSEILGDFAGKKVLKRFKDRIEAVGNKYKYSFLTGFNKLVETLNDPNSNGFFNMIGDALNVKTRTKKSVSIAHQNRIVDFDLITRRSIVEVIPGYLSKILAAVTGNKEIIFNHDTNEFEDKNDLSDRIMADINSAGTSNLDYTLNNLYDKNHIIKRKRKEDEVINISEESLRQINRNIMNSNETFDAKKGTTYLRNKYGHDVPEADFNNFLKMFKKMNTDDQGTYIQSILESRKDREIFLKKFEVDLQENGLGNIVGHRLAQNRLDELRGQTSGVDSNLADVIKYDSEGMVNKTATLNALKERSKESKGWKIIQKFAGSEKLESAMDAEIQRLREIQYLEHQINSNSATPIRQNQLQTMNNNMLSSLNDSNVILRNIEGILLSHFGYNFNGEISGPPFGEIQKENNSNNILSSIKNPESGISLFTSNNKRAQSELNRMMRKNPNFVLRLAKKLKTNSDGVNRSMSGLNPEFRKRLNAFLSEVGKYGVSIKESNRSPLTQLTYYAKGRANDDLYKQLTSMSGLDDNPDFKDNSGMITNNLTSGHFNGMAVDLNPGRLSYKELGKIAKKYGIAWSPKDEPHFELDLRSKVNLPNIEQSGTPQNDNIDDIIRFFNDRIQESKAQRKKLTLMDRLKNLLKGSATGNFLENLSNKFKSKKAKFFGFLKRKFHLGNTIFDKLARRYQGTKLEELFLNIGELAKNIQPDEEPKVKPTDKISKILDGLEKAYSGTIIEFEIAKAKEYIKKYETKSLDENVAGVGDKINNKISSAIDSLYGKDKDGKDSFFHDPMKWIGKRSFFKKAKEFLFGVRESNPRARKKKRVRKSRIDKLIRNSKIDDSSEKSFDIDKDGNVIFRKDGTLTKKDIIDHVKKKYGDKAKKIKITYIDKDGSTKIMDIDTKDLPYLRTFDTPKNMKTKLTQQATYQELMKKLRDSRNHGGMLGLVGSFFTLTFSKLNRVLFGENEDKELGTVATKGIVGNIWDGAKKIFGFVKHASYKLFDYIFGNKEHKTFGLFQRLAQPALKMFEKTRHHVMEKIINPFKSIGRQVGISLKWVYRDSIIHIKNFGKLMKEVAESAKGLFEKIKEKLKNLKIVKTISKIFETFKDWLVQTKGYKALANVIGSIKSGAGKLHPMKLAQKFSENRMRGLLASGKINQEDYDEWREKYASDVDREDLKHAKNMKILEEFRGKINEHLIKDPEERKKYLEMTATLNEEHDKIKNMSTADIKADAKRAKEARKRNLQALKEGKTLSKEELEEGLTAQEAYYKHIDDNKKKLQQEVDRQKSAYEKEILNLDRDRNNLLSAIVYYVSRGEAGESLENQNKRINQAQEYVTAKYASNQSYTKKQDELRKLIEEGEKIDKKKDRKKYKEYRKRKAALEKEINNFNSEYTNIEKELDNSDNAKAYMKTSNEQKELRERIKSGKLYDKSLDKKPKETLKEKEKFETSKNNADHINAETGFEQGSREDVKKSNQIKEEQKQRDKLAENVQVIADEIKKNNDNKNVEQESLIKKLLKHFGPKFANIAKLGTAVLTLFKLFGAAGKIKKAFQRRKEYGNTEMLGHLTGIQNEGDSDYDMYGNEKSISEKAKDRYKWQREVLKSIIDKKHRDKVVKRLNNAGDIVAKPIRWGGRKIVNMVNGTIDIAKQFGQATSNAIKGVGKAAKWVGKTASDINAKGVDKAKGVLKGLGNKYKKADNAIHTLDKKATQKIFNIFNKTKNVVGNKGAIITRINNFLSKGIEFVTNWLVQNKKISLDIAKKIKKNLCGQIMKNVKKLAGKRLVAFCAKMAGRAIGIVNAACILVDFTNGMTQAAKYFQIDKDKVSVSMRLASGIAGVISGFTMGLVSPEWLTSVIFNLIPNKSEKQKLAKFQEEYKLKAQALSSNQNNIDPNRLSEYENKSLGEKFIRLFQSQRTKDLKDARLLGFDNTEDYNAWKNNVYNAQAPKKSPMVKYHNGEVIMRNKNSHFAINTIPSSIQQESDKATVDKEIRLAKATINNDLQTDQLQTLSSKAAEANSNKELIAQGKEGNGYMGEMVGLLSQLVAINSETNASQKQICSFNKERLDLDKKSKEDRNRMVQSMIMKDKRLKKEYDKILKNSGGSRDRANEQFANTYAVAYSDVGT